MGARAKPPMQLMRAALYVRVSSEEQVVGYSLDAQERAGRAYCAAHGWQLTQIYRDEGRSARTDDLAKRPAFARMLTDAERGQIDVVIVHKLDRFARNLRVTLELLERLERSDVAFVSISEQMDFTTPIGKVILATLAAFAQYYSDNLSAETKKGKAERKAQGLPNGLIPFGATTTTSGVPVLDETPWACNLATRQELIPAVGLRHAFTLATEGKSDKEIAQALTAAGYRTGGNRGQNPFSKDTVRVILRNRFYLGELPDGNDGWLPGKHSALIDPALFEGAQQARARNNKRPQWTQSVRSPWALSGLATCGACGANITADGKHRARCAGRTQGNGCTQPSFTIEPLETQLAEVLAAFAVPASEQHRLVAAWHAAQGKQPTTASALRRIDGKLARVKELYLDGALTRTEYQLRLRSLEEERAALPSDDGPDEAMTERLAAFLADLPLAWGTATPAERNRLARQLFGSVTLFNRTAVAVVPRPELHPFFAVNPLLKSCTGGSDGLRSRARTTSTGVVLVGLPPARRTVGRSGRAPYSTQRPRQLTDEERAAICSLALTKSLRSLAAEFGVSHETVRRVIRETDAAVA